MRNMLIWRVDTGINKKQVAGPWKAGSPRYSHRRGVRLAHEALLEKDLPSSIYNKKESIFNEFKT